MYTATVTVTDGAGASDTYAVHITVNFNVVGNAFKQPVNNTRNGQPTSIFKCGSTIPLKLEVTDCNGSHPANLEIRVYWQKISGGVPQGELEAVATNSPDTGNLMRVTGSDYMFNWNTKLVTDRPSPFGSKRRSSPRGRSSTRTSGSSSRRSGGRRVSACPPSF